MNQQIKESFIRYCADVMGWEFKLGSYQDTYFANKGDVGWTQINPYDDLNQMAEVVEKLLTEYDYCYSSFPSQMIIATKGVKRAFRDFIISTMPKDK